MVLLQRCVSRQIISRTVTEEECNLQLVLTKPTDPNSDYVTPSHDGKVKLIEDSIEEDFFRLLVESSPIVQTGISSQSPFLSLTTTPIESNSSSPILSPTNTPIKTTKTATPTPKKPRNSPKTPIPRKNMKVSVQYDTGWWDGKISSKKGDLIYVKFPGFKETFKVNWKKENCKPREG